MYVRKYTIPILKTICGKLKKYQAIDFKTRLLAWLSTTSFCDPDHKIDSKI